MKTPDEVLSGMNRDAEGGFLTADVIATHQVEATLILAEQVKRIADLLESITWQPDDDQQRALIVIQPHAEGSVGPG